MFGYQQHESCTTTPRQDRDCSTHNISNSLTHSLTHLTHSLIQLRLRHDLITTSTTTATTTIIILTNTITAHTTTITTTLTTTITTTLTTTTITAHTTTIISTAPHPVASQSWTHGPDGTLSTDAQHCLRWKSDDHTALVSECAASTDPHQRWAFENGTRLTTEGAGDMVSGSEGGMQCG